MKRFKYIILAAIFLVGTSDIIKAQNGIIVGEISGTVYESATGKPLAGAQVTIPGVTSAITGDNGEFILNKRIPGAYLVVNAPGYATKQVQVFGNKPVKVGLFDESFKGKYEEVAMPFDMRNARMTTYSLSNHENREDYKLASATIESVLQGNVNGLNTVLRTGTPGSGGNMFLNGFNSLNANTQPLIILDGMQYENQTIYSLIGGNVVSPLSDIDINDIANITILKDGASIYGSKGANGVLLINTIQAKGVATRINFHSYAGVNFEPNTKYKMMDARNYKNYLTDMLSSEGLSSSEMRNLPYLNAEVPVVENWGVSGNKDYYRYNQSTNWQDEVFNNSINQNYYLNVAGGNEGALYAISFGYLNHGGTVDNTSFSRYTTRVNARITMTDWFKLNANMSFVYSERGLAYEGTNRNFNPVFASLIKAPFTSPYVYNVLDEKTPNLEGADVFNVSNPMAIINNSEVTNDRFRFLGALNGIVTFSKYLNANVLFGLTTDKVTERLFYPEAGIYHSTLPSAIVINESQQLRNHLLQVNADARLNYQRTFNFVHDLNVRLGFRYQTTNEELDWGKSYNSSSDEMKTLQDGMNTLAQIGGSLGNWKTLSNYLNVEYGYLNRYFVSLNAALDGSSRFGKNANGISLFNNVYGFFPSVNGAWLITSEDFMKNQHVIDFLKLRAGYSITGNDDIGNYSARQYYVPQGLLGAYGLVRGNISNPELQWETNKKASIGVDVSFLKERLNMSIDLYISKTQDLLALKNIGTNSGIGVAVMNDGELQNKGIDLNLSGRLIDHTNFKWDMGLNLSTYKNKLLSMSTDETFTEIAGGVVRTKVGYPIGQFYGYQTEGVFSKESDASAANLKIVNKDGSIHPFTAGDVIFTDNERDNVINDADKRVIGDPTPDFFGSLTNQFKWKRFSLNALLAFSVGNDVYNSVRANLESMSGTDNQSIAAMYRWKADGQVTNIPKAVWGDPMGNSRFSDRWIEDGSYIRLKSATLAYDLPLKKGVVESLQIYLTGNNLLTFSNYLGFDPEFSSGQNPLYYGIDCGVTPQPRTILFGIKIGL